jgi:hypothetical protein
MVLMGRVDAAIGGANQTHIGQQTRIIVGRLQAAQCAWQGKSFGMKHQTGVTHDQIS